MLQKRGSPRVTEGRPVFRIDWKGWRLKGEMRRGRKGCQHEWQRQGLCIRKGRGGLGRVGGEEIEGHYCTYKSRNKG